MIAPPAIVPVGLCVFNFLTQVLLWFGLELPRKVSGFEWRWDVGFVMMPESRSARLNGSKFQKRNLLTLEAQDQDPETQPHFAHSSGWKQFFYRLPLGVANQ